MTNAELIQKLKEVGLTVNQITIYLELLNLKKCRAGALIKNTKLHRSIVYTNLDDLMAKGLVSKLIQGGVSVFELTSPTNLITMMDAKRQAAEAAARELTKLSQDQPRDIRVFDGPDGILQARERCLALKPGDTLYVMGGSKWSTTPAYEAVWVPFHKNRIENGINQKIMFDRAVSSEYIADRNSWPLTKAKYLPFNQYMPAWFEAYGDTFTVGVPSKDPVTFSLRNPEAATALKNFFEYLWNQQITIESGQEALKQAIFGMLDELQPNEEYHVLGASFGHFKRQDMMSLYTEYHERRIAKKVIINMLAYSESANQISELFRRAGDSELKLSHLKTMDQAIQNPMQVYLFHGKAMAVIMGEEPTVMRFEQKEVHDNFRAYFDSLWQQESHVRQGPEALRDLWLEAVEAKELKFIGARGYFIDRYPELFTAIKQKAEKTPGVIWKNVVGPQVRGHAITKLRWSQTRYTSKLSKNPNVIWIYGGKIAIANWSGDIPIIFTSKNKHLYQSYDDYFNELWGEGK